MKLLILNDSHDKGKNPISRIDDYHRACLEKLEETIELSKECDVVIHAGDVWDSPFVSNSIIDDWLDRIENSKIPWYIVDGNHDQIGASWETSKASVLAHVFRRSPSIKRLNEYRNDIEGQNNAVYIKGYSYYFGCEEDFKENGLFHNEVGKDTPTIAITHAFFSPDFFPFASHVELKDIKTNYDIVVCSHFHKAFYEVINGTQFINLGPFMRRSITEAYHIPKVSIIDTKTKEVKVIPLNCAKIAEKCFDLAKKEGEKEVSKDLSKFLESLEDFQFKSMDTRQKIKELAKLQSTEKNVVDDILGRLNKNE